MACGECLTNDEWEAIQRCSKAPDEGHCDHWWDGLEPCCHCGDNTAPMTSEEGA